MAIASPVKETREFSLSGQPRGYVLEAALAPDFGLVRALRGDRHGNLVFHQSARNFNPLCAMAGRVTIAEVEELVEPGQLEPDGIHTSGIYVKRIFQGKGWEKPIENRTVRKRSA